MGNVAWIGLGQMGRPMAANLLGAGHTVFGVDISKDNARDAAQAGITLVDSAVDAAERADVVFTTLPNGDLVSEVLAGPSGVFAVAGHRPVVDCSTIDIATAAALHAEADERGVAFIDAPMSGGITGARAGSLTFMVGGTTAHHDAVLPYLQVMGGHVVHVGEATAGQAMKIVNNMMLGINLAGVCEGALLAERLGLDPRVVHDVAGRASADSWAMRTWCPFPGVVPTAPSSNDFVAGFTTNLLIKDMALALTAARDEGLTLTVAENAVSRYRISETQGNGGRDCSSLILDLQRAYPRRTGVDEVAS